MHVDGEMTVGFVLQLYQPNPYFDKHVINGLQPRRNFQLVTEKQKMDGSIIKVHIVNIHSMLFPSI